MAELTVEPIACLKDNYAYLVAEANLCAVVDPSEAEPVLQALKARDLKLSYILNTHHHWDHTGGNAALKQATGALVVGPEKDRGRIPAIDIGVDEKSGWRFGERPVAVLEVPGHTSGAIAFVIGEAVFTGDTLFVMGCGRLFEGTPAMMVQSLGKLAALPDETKVYCGHEYTLTNARFAMTLEAGNAALRARLEEVTALRLAERATVPSTIVLEKATNPFLRTDSAEIRATLRTEKATPVEVFAEIRRRKDAF
jgi:hydroxyacylglutathione hydrolase